MNKKILQLKFIIILQIITAIFISSDIYFVNNSVKLEMNKDDFLSNNTMTCTIEKPNINFFKKLSLLNDNFLLVKDNVVPEYGVYVSGEMNLKVPLIEGKFLNHDDCNNNDKVIVIGKTLVSNQINKDGVNYYYYHNEYYKVIGILGDEKKVTAYDCNIYYNLNLDQIVNLAGNYYFDGNNNTSSIFSKIQGIANTTETQISEKTLEKDKSVIDIVNKNYVSSLKDSINILILIFLSVMLIAEFWIKSKTKELGIRRLLGASKLKILFSVVIELLLTTFISFTIGYLLYLVFTYLKDGYFHFYFTSMIMVFALSIISTIISLVVPIYYVNRVEPSKIIK